ncbi:hypothetical protein PILCRDRAFT_16029 [Piloderma croceum F 1598]|uniref:Uncharacterized protein n=1 Tax=Piloderma croceum (strain F 1598) TaxID=765440 RepID=A0A0C3B5J8_PILCF|nr:hypothetical protein PILCRDRAFT_16029 [Piloderma croceum F 1598]
MAWVHSVQWKFLVYYADDTNYKISIQKLFSRSEMQNSDLRMALALLKLCSTHSTLVVPRFQEDPAF